VLFSASIENLFLDGSLLPGLIADRLDVHGNVHLRHSESTATLRLPGARLGGNLDLEGSKLAAPRNPDGSHFGTAVTADEVRVGGNVILQSARTIGEVRLSGAEIGGSLICDEARFRGATDAWGNVSETLSIERLRGRGGVFLRGVVARGTVRLTAARFESTLECTGSRIRAARYQNDALIADGIHVTGNAGFSNIRTDGVVRFVGAVFSSTLDLSDAKLRAGTDTQDPPAPALLLDSAKVAETFYLRNQASIRGGLSLVGAEVGAISDHLPCWPKKGSLRLNGLRYGALLGPTDAKSRLNWLGRQNSETQREFWPQPYEQCAMVLRAMGHDDDARRIILEKERLQRASRRARMGLMNRCLRYVGDTLSGWTVGYGRHPLRALLWLLLLALLGTVIFWQGFRHGVMVPTDPAAVSSQGWKICAQSEAKAQFGIVQCFLDAEDGRYYPRFQPLVYSLETILPVVDLGQRSNWMPDPERWPWLVWFLRGYTIAGWLLGLLAIAGLSGLIKRD
jgi:hypothetical protein